jgi:hypothetical protein
MSRRGTRASAGRTPAITQIEKWFVWYGVPHFVQDFHRSGDFLRLFLPKPVPVLSLPIVRDVAWVVFEVISLFRWVGRRIWYDLRHLRKEASRALPMLAVLTILGFFSNDLWHIASDMGYLRLLFVLIGFTALGLLFLDARLPQEIDKQLAEGNCFTASAIDAAWKQHEKRLPEWDGRPAAARPLLDDAQKRNMRVYLLFCQVIQVSLLSVVVWVFFLVLGKLVFTNALLGDWFPKGGPQYPVHVWFVSVPFISTQLLSASAFMAILASIIFAVQAVVDENYRAEFFTPTVDGLMEAARIRCAYLTLLSPTEAAHPPDVGPPPKPGAYPPPESSAPTEPVHPTAAAN